MRLLYHGARYKGVTNQIEFNFFSSSGNFLFQAESQRGQISLPPFFLCQRERIYASAPSAARGYSCTYCFKYIFHIRYRRFYGKEEF